MDTTGLRHLFDAGVQGRAARRGVSPAARLACDWLLVTRRLSHHHQSSSKGTTVQHTTLSTTLLCSDESCTRIPSAEGRLQQVSTNPHLPPSRVGQHVAVGMATEAARPPGARTHHAAP